LSCFLTENPTTCRLHLSLSAAALASVTTDDTKMAETTQNAIM
jgi:hypothetical protein